MFNVSNRLLVCSESVVLQDRVMLAAPISQARQLSFKPNGSSGPITTTSFDKKFNGKVPGSYGPVTEASSISVAPGGVYNSSKVIVVRGVFDGKNATFNAAANLGDGSNRQDQKPLFVLMPGASLRNVRFGSNGVDGIHTLGNATLSNVHWADVGEDALTMRFPGHVVISGGSAIEAADKVFQVNASGSLSISNFSAAGFGTLVTTNESNVYNTRVEVLNGTYSQGGRILKGKSPQLTGAITGNTFQGVGTVFDARENPSLTKQVTVSGNKGR